MSGDVDPQELVSGQENKRSNADLVGPVSAAKSRRLAVVPVVSKYVDSDDEDVDDEIHVSPRPYLHPVEDPTEQALEGAAPPCLSPPPDNEPPDAFLHGCRSVECYERLNRIQEGTYGVVYRAKDIETGEIVALKKIKMENEKEGFPITSMREIKILLQDKHPNIVNVKEIVLGSTLSSIFIVMEYMEHDLKSLMGQMDKGFLGNEIKCFMFQIVNAIAHLHRNWIIHRDLKTSNLLYNNDGVLKLADFGMAREYGDPMGSPLRHLTPLVVTLWYRAPELLLGQKRYTTAVDMWSIGCIMGELLLNESLIMGKNEADQIDKIIQLLGTPTNSTWPGYGDLPYVRRFKFKKVKRNNLLLRFQGKSVHLRSEEYDLLSKLLTCDPAQRITAEEMLKHPYFTSTEMTSLKDMPKFPSTHEGKRLRTPTPEWKRLWKMEARMGQG